MAVHITHGNVCFGKKRPRRSLRMLSLSNYMNANAVPFPQANAWERPISWQMLGNDAVGDCTVAAALHMQMAWSSVAHAGSPLTYTTDQAISLYSAITGYNPADPSTDQGAVETDVLNYWKNTGMDGLTIAGFASIDVQNIDQVKAATFIFGGLYLGFNVPNYIMNVAAGGSWSQTAGADTTIVGGHAIPILGYGRNGTTCVSWGTTYTFDWNFWQEYVDEAYAVVSTQWIKASGVSPTGLDLQGLLADLPAAA
jgi:hypothetical protein